jgi:hypothetical protein
MTKRATHRELIEAEVARATDQLIRHVRNEDRLAVVQAPPGSGKTRLLLQAVAEGYKRKQRVAIATQTRSQADDICRRLVADFSLPGIRFVAKNGVSPNVPSGIQVLSDKNALPSDRCIVVATTAKWGTIELAHPFDMLVVEEAWQMAWADFMLLGQVAPRFVLIGDPGQIEPVVSIDTARWETAPRGPHRAAPELVLQEHRKEALALELPATWRLPSCTAELIRPFYDFEFGTWAEPGERKLAFGRHARGALGAAVERLGAGSVVGLTLPTPAGGPPLEQDDEVATLAVDAVRTILECQPTYLMDIGARPASLKPEDIGLCATHHVMNAAMALRRDKKLSDVGIDTPERWQGLERKVMVVVHPLSGVVRPSEFDLATGRLCVMASRHQIALVIVSRDHLATTLESHLPVADQPVGRADVSGRGHAQNLSFWTSLIEQDRVISL